MKEMVFSPFKAIETEAHKKAQTKKTTKQKNPIPQTKIKQKINKQINKTPQKNPHIKQKKASFREKAGGDR